MRSRCIDQWLTRALDVFVLLALLTSCILLTLNVTGPGERLLDVDVYVPKSFKPFSNIGTRIGLHTEWSLNTVKIHNIITDKLDETIKIDELARLYGNLTTLVEVLPEAKKLLPSSDNCQDEPDSNCSPTLRVIRAIQKSTRIMRSSFTAALYAFGTASVLYIIFLSSQRQDIHTGPRNELGGSQGEMMLRLPLCSVNERSMGGTVNHQLDRSRGFSVVCYRVAVILTLLGCLGLCITVITHYDDVLGNVQKMLPMLIRKLSWICLTHNSEECQIVYTLQPAAFALVGSLMTVFLTALATTALRF